MNGTVTGWAALAIALGTGIIWFRRAYAVALPEDRRGFIAAMIAAAAIGVAAFGQGPGWAGGVPAGVALFLAALFLLTIAIGDQTGGSGHFELGRPLPNFTAPDENGEPFAIASLTGNPILLKFFRGHW